MKNKFCILASKYLSDNVPSKPSILVGVKEPEIVILKDSLTSEEFSVKFKHFVLEFKSMTVAETIDGYSYQWVTLPSNNHAAYFTLMIEHQGWYSLQFYKNLPAHRRTFPEG